MNYQGQTQEQERHVSQNYAALRVVRVRPPVGATTKLQSRYPTGWLPEGPLVHLLTRHAMTIGRAPSNDIVLTDPTVSREHARLVLDQYGWRIINLTVQNIVRVNGQPVPSGGSLPLRPQDTLILGSTMLQLIAPQSLAPTQQQPSADGSMGPKAALEQRRPPITPPPQPPMYPTYPQSPPGQYSPLASPQHVPVIATPLPVQPEPEFVAQPWEKDEEEHLLGPGVTMQLALPERMSERTRWLMVGGGVALLVISTLLTIAITLLDLSVLNRVSSVLAVLTIPLIPAIGIYLLVNFIDRFEREPWFLLLAAFLWGAVIAPPVALIIEASIHLDPGVTEEAVKGLGLLLLFFVLRDEFDNVTDGIVYGALIGAGFAMVENFQYFAKFFNILPSLIVGRIILTWLGHSTYTACFGVALGYARHTRVRWRQIGIPLLGYLFAAGLHSFFDFNPLLGLLPNFLAQMVILYMLIKALAHEKAVIREFLAPEVSSGVVRVDEYVLLQNSFQRTRQERRVLWRSGIRQWLRVKALYQTEIGLAFRKWHVSMGDKPKLGYRQPEDLYRQRIERLRQKITVAQRGFQR